MIYVYTNLFVNTANVKILLSVIVGLIRINGGLFVRLVSILQAGKGLSYAWKKEIRR